MLVLQDAKAVFPFASGVDGAVVKCRLRIEVKFAGPPGLDAIFKLCPVGVEIVSAALRAEGCKIFDFEVPGFLKIVVVGDKVWVVLGPERVRKSQENQRE